MWSLGLQWQTRLWEWEPQRKRGPMSWIYFYVCHPPRDGGELTALQLFNTTRWRISVVSSGRIRVEQGHRKNKIYFWWGLKANNSFFFSLFGYFFTAYSKRWAKIQKWIIPFVPLLTRLRASLLLGHWTCVLAERDATEVVLAYVIGSLTKALPNQSEMCLLSFILFPRQNCPV